MSQKAHIAGSYHAHVRTDVLPHVPPGEGTLLDLGGGVGATALAARDRGLATRVGVIDRVAPLPALDYAYSGDLNDPTTIERVGAEQGPLTTILCLDILEHLVDPWAVVAGLHRLLKPGGTIVASIPNVRHISVVLPLLTKRAWDLADDGVLDRTHLRFFTESTAVELMTSSGLMLDRVVPLLDGGKAERLFGWLPLAGIRDFAAMQYMVRVTRPA